MTKNEFEEVLKEIEIISIKKVTTYKAGLIVALSLLMATLVSTFIVLVLPLHRIFLNIVFAGGMVAGIYNLSVELLSPKWHLHWFIKVPVDFKGWRILYLISKCITYDRDKNLIVLQFDEEIEPQLEKELLKLIKTRKSQD